LNNKFKTIARNDEFAVKNTSSGHRKIVKKRRNNQPKHAYMSIAAKEFKNA